MVIAALTVHPVAVPDWFTVLFRGRERNDVHHGNRFLRSQSQDHHPDRLVLRSPLLKPSLMAGQEESFAEVSHPG